MRGVILAGGLATRLGSISKTQNKHLLPIFNKPMIYYPIETLINAGINEILIIVSGPHAGNFIHVLENGEEFGLKSLKFSFQKKANGGIADALSLAKEFANNEPIAVILGDNTTDAQIGDDIKYFERINSMKSFEPPMAKVFLKKVPNPTAFGVAELSEDGAKIINIEEKPENPKSNYAVTGLYIYDRHVFDFISKCSPSERGELEVTDINNMYIQKGRLEWSELNGFWQDAGSFENLLKANVYWARKAGVEI